MSRLPIVGPFAPKGADPANSVGTLAPRPDPLPRSVGLLYRFNPPKPFLSSQEVTVAFDSTDLHLLSGDLSLSFQSESPLLGRLPRAPAGRSAWNQPVVSQEGWHPVSSICWARSMLLCERGTPSGTCGASGRRLLALMGEIRCMPCTAPRGSMPEREGNDERACHPLPPCLRPLGAVLHRLAAYLPKVDTGSGHRPTSVGFFRRPWCVANHLRTPSRVAITPTIWFDPRSGAMLVDGSSSWSGLQRKTLAHP